MENKPTISIIGTGNVSWHLGHALNNAGLLIHQVLGRNAERAKVYGKAIHAKPVNTIAELDLNVDVIFICVTDDQVLAVEQSVPEFDGLLAHTSGSIPINADRQNCSVFYPLQTFSKDVPVAFNEIPILLESHSNKYMNTLQAIASKLSNSVYQVSSAQREKLHVAAVFANNFANHMFAQAYEICAENNIPFDVLHPLLIETALKATKANPATAQTGPAIRNDQLVIEKHLSLLTQADQRELYQAITQSILKNNETEL